MQFFSLNFALFFLMVLAAYFLLPKKYQYLCLLAASYVFYLRQGVQGAVFLVLTTVVVYTAGLLLERQQLAFAERTQAPGCDAALKKREKALCQRRKRQIVTVSVVLCIGALALSKYSDQLLGSVNAALGALGASARLDGFSIIKPLGISFYTLQAIGYLIEVYRGKTKAEHNLLRFALFISYFPQVVQGPISKYQDLTKTLYAPHDWDSSRALSGALRILWGYFKKLVIADRVGVAVQFILGGQNPNAEGLIVLTTFILYGFQIYADFSGCMDIVLGISEIFGIQVTQNFARPYFARSVAEFWQRWHITLGAWMRNYVFYPLALSKPFNQMGRKLRRLCGPYAAKVLPTSLASFIVFLLVGIWHGTGWKYVAYGLYNAVFVSSATLLEPLYERARRRLNVREESRVYHLLQMLRTALLTTLGRYFSRAGSFSAAIALYRATFVRNMRPLFFLSWEENFGQSVPDAICAGVAVLIMFAVDLLNERGVCVRREIAKKPTAMRWAFYMIAIYSIIIFGAYGVGFDASAFIYQGF